MIITQKQNMGEIKKEAKKMNEQYIGKYVIARGDRSGVYAGTLLKRNGQEALLGDTRNLWYWEGAASVLQLAETGPMKPEGCKFTMTVQSLLLTDVIEIIPATKQAELTIKGVVEWKR